MKIETLLRLICSAERCARHSHAERGNEIIFDVHSLRSEPLRFDLVKLAGLLYGGQALVEHGE
jgi:hypothetical protein